MPESKETKKEDNDNFLPPMALLGVMRHIGMICVRADTTLMPPDLIAALREKALGFISFWYLKIDGTSRPTS
ncbi:hypothetical protein R1flu_013793 [Riccia fluitans]|uniref:Uncharacterized protein n=1 Tax=Riccia fluitans TaxID=41844 RepID=A0ABD1YHZ3_9MARC